ncbi:MAG: DNA repair protein RecO C-terminal domain-containing protein, partial [Deltaproteobacteria bacterium]|nr:DNA repair protein RecO C-terminal domain-containing protein [Deltaproteobacteria bacterium]
LSKALKHIDREGVQKEIFWSVMLEYLEALGIDPHFEECVRCGPESQAMLLGFDIWRAGMVCQQCSTHSNPFIEISASLLNWIRFQKNLDSNEVPLLEKDEKVLDRLLRQHTKIQLDIDLEWGRFLHFI